MDPAGRQQFIGLGDLQDSRDLEDCVSTYSYYDCKPTITIRQYATLCTVDSSLQ
eukprot:jgi/Botrbrau1/2295/Bobra.101_2s0116.1